MKASGAKNMTAISKIGIGPMSEEVVEAVFRYAENYNVPLMLIPSKNQIDWDGGYVNNWTTRQFADYASNLKQKYPKAKVYLCRDHCGPGFKSTAKNAIKDVYQTIDNDLENNFDLIHIDFCHHPGYRNQVFEESKRAIDYILKQKPDILIEVGTDENSGTILSGASQDIRKVEEEMKFFTQIAPIHFFVCQTGSLVKEVNQVGKFNQNFMQLTRQLAQVYRVNLKEHNADYIDADTISQRRGLIDAVNVAPQYGVLQTKITIQKAAIYGIDYTDFLDESLRSGKWRKWLHHNDENNKFLCALIAGHYVFGSDAYKKLYEKISRHENLREEIINAVMKNIHLYHQSL